jgi:DNA-binding transcriptional LysR family regulator
VISPTPSSLLGARSNTLLGSYHIFAELVGCKSMSEAAWNLDLDVSVVSRHIAAVEQTFGCTLFDRHGRGVRLTPAGQLVADYVATVLGADARVRQQLADLHDLRSGHLRIIGTDGAIASPVPRALTALSQLYPGIKFELYRASSELVIPALREGKADVGAGLNLEPEAGVEIVASLDDELVAVMTADHPLAGSATVTLADVATFPVGTFERNSGVGRVLQKIGKREGISLTTTLVTNSLEALKQFCASEGRISLLCLHSVRSELDAGRLVAVRLRSTGRPVKLRLDACVDANTPRSFAVTAFLRQLVEQCGFTLHQPAA